MSSSRPKIASISGSSSSANRELNFAADVPSSSLSPEIAGTMNDAAAVRSVIVDAMKKCPKSRAAIADEMSHLTGTKVTERMLNAYAAESREDNRFPLELQRAFCFAVGDTRLLTSGPTAAGLHVVDNAGLELLELGRQYLIRKRSEAELADIERRLEGKKL